MSLVEGSSEKPQVWKGCEGRMSGTVTSNLAIAACATAPLWALAALIIERRQSHAPWTSNRFATIWIGGFVLVTALTTPWLIHRIN